MKSNLKTGFPVLAAALLLAGCSQPEKNADFQVAAVRTGGDGRTSGRVTLSDNGTLDLDAVVREVKVIAKRQATARQRSVAQVRARKIAARPRPAGAKPARYLVVATDRDVRSVGQESVMLWDTYSSDVVGNNVFDIQSAPAAGALVKFETFSAEYVGTGS